MQRALAYDKWCSDQMTALLLWMDEWLSISQARFEQGVICFYIATMAICHSHFPPFVRGAEMLVYGPILWSLHRRTAAMREACGRSVHYRLLRVSFQCFIICVTAVAVIAEHNWRDVGLIAQMVAYLIIFYTTDINSNGESGRKRKLAWDQLKKLFGEMAWIPKPVDA